MRRHEPDEVTIEAVLAGHRVETTIADREEIVYRLTAGNLSDPEIATRTGMTANTVLRIRRRLNIPAPVDNKGRPVEAPKPVRSVSSGAIQHPGTQHVIDGTDRSTGSSPFFDAFFADPFNRLVQRTPDLPCVDRWDIFSPPEKPDDFDYNAWEHKEAEKRRRAEGRALCLTCPIRLECLDYALRTGERDGERAEFGIWGGTVEKERSLLHRTRTPAP